MHSTQDTAGPVAPAPRAIISGYTVSSPRRLAGAVDQMCLTGLLEDVVERDADRCTRRKQVSHSHSEYVVVLFRQHQPGRFWRRPLWAVEEVNLSGGATRLWIYRTRSWGRCAGPPWRRENGGAPVRDADRTVMP